ncbi:mitochondrial ribosomal protein S25 [Podospora appendiculata]|uniref:37S ribosomal protein S25, mitochondrial n=1 Tax=Podospora appendiculata TaxID=314037 RepID=A0AAE1C9F8_9PEZI|nr:mitochondrial ribosomal protein S25 [Podospora appendiculata]
MGKSFRAAKVYQTAQEYVATSIIPGRKVRTAPAWFNALASIPPAEILTRPYPVQHAPPNPHARKPHHVFRPTQIVYPEDELRRDFFKDHPWELARPKMLLELDGKDARYRDWSTGLQQPGMPLSGECVVQRQLWMMENIPGMTKQAAYDAARKEFYKLRQQEDIERRIAVEEARMTGAYFGKTTIQFGLDIEDREYEAWKRWAATQIAKLDAERNQVHTSVVDVPAEEELAAVGAL